MGGLEHSTRGSLQVCEHPHRQTALPQCHKVSVKHLEQFRGYPHYTAAEIRTTVPHWVIEPPFFAIIPIHSLCRRKQQHHKSIIFLPIANDHFKHVFFTVEKMICGNWREETVKCASIFCISICIFLQIILFIEILHNLGDSTTS